MDRGWLARESCLHDPRLPVDHVDFDAVAVLKEGVAAPGVRGIQGEGSRLRISKNSSTANRAWLDDYVLYQSLKDVHAGLPWYEWEPELIERDPAALARWRERLTEGNPSITSSCNTCSSSSGKSCGRRV